jgi:ketosteroid isomerase-like protein
MSPADDLRETLDQAVAALNHLVNGDAGPYLGLWSHADDVTVMGGFGSFEKGWARVRQNTEFAASRFRGGRLLGVEEMAVGSSGDLAYAVWIERGEVRLEGRDELGPLVVRVTHIFRREDGAWRLIHRHGDPIVEKTEATAVLQR